MKKIIIFCFLFFVSMYSYGQKTNIEEIANQSMLPYMNPTLNENKEWNESIRQAEKRVIQIGKNAIPYLLNLINVNILGYYGILDTFSSQIPISAVMPNPQGMKAAYFIERIISNKGEQDIYKNCIIVKISNGKQQIDNVLTFEDMTVIKKVYQDWWEINKKKTPIMLQKDWEDNKKILTNNRDYVWI